MCKFKWNFRSSQTHNPDYSTISYQYSWPMFLLTSCNFFSLCFQCHYLCLIIFRTEGKRHRFGCELQTNGRISMPSKQTHWCISFCCHCTIVSDPLVPPFIMLIEYFHSLLSNELRCRCGCIASRPIEGENINFWYFIEWIPQRRLLATCKFFPLHHQDNVHVKWSERCVRFYFFH